MDADDGGQVPVLGFANPRFHAGVNLSVRRGTGWLGVPRVRIELGGGRLSAPLALATTALRFDQLRDADLADEHDPACRSVAGLLAVMRRCYPGFAPAHTVTLCRFVLG